MFTRRVLAITVLFTLMVACFVIAPSCAASKAKTPYVIGAIFTTTGDNAPLGVPERNTVEMLVKQINKKGGVDGHPLKVIYYDDAGNPQQAAQACQELLTNKSVVAIVGPTLTGPALAIASMCERAKMPLLACAASVKIVSPVKSYVFKTAQSDSQAVYKLIDYLKKHKLKKVAFINDSNAFGASGREQWDAISKNVGIKTVARETFGSNDTSMTSQLTKIKAAKPDAIICWGTNPAPAIVARDARTLGLKIPLLMSHGVSNKTFIDLGGKAVDGVVFPSGKIIVANAISKSDPQKKVLMKYAADYQAAYKKPASHFGGHAWDSMMLVVNALDKVGPDKAKIRKHIESTKNFIGIDGVFNFSPKDHNGLTKDAFTLVEVKNGQWRLAK